VAALGIARTFQNVALFKGMSVLDNIMTGRLLKMRGNVLLDAVYWGPAKKQELEHRAVVERIIAFLEIEAIRKTPAGRLPYGLQKRVELARALAAEPTLLLLDEPMAGMNVEEKEDMCRFILDVRDEFGTTIALIEHDMSVVMDISDRVVALDYGPEDRRRHAGRGASGSSVLDAYLGVAHASDPSVTYGTPPRARGAVRRHGRLTAIPRRSADRRPGLGALYSLVALGFVLIFKASGVFNFAQGAMVLFSALTLVGLMDRGVPALVALALTIVVMILLAYAIERIVLRPLVNQEPIILFMATIGLNFFLEGFGEMLWGANVKKLDVGIPDTSFKVAGILVNRLEIAAALTAAVLVTVLALFFQKTRIGRALRAVADDHEAALSIGIPLRTIWVVVWSAAGLVALAAGVMWGAKSGVQFSLSLIALKALPVLILGGFTSVPGRHRGRDHHRRGREGGRSVLGAARGRGDRELVRLRHGARLPPRASPGPLRRANHRKSLTRDLPGGGAVQDDLTRATRRSSRFLRIGCSSRS
jgi:branched-chain amino acid transport system permease protein